MKFSSLFFASILSAATLIAQDRISGNGPQITFAQEEIDYGMIKEGSDGRRTFIFKNTGNEPLMISSCRGSCGCTVPICPTDVILPGKTSKVDVMFDTKRLGQFQKTITVVSNAINFPTLLLRIRGFVETINSTPLQLTTPLLNVRQQR